MHAILLPLGSHGDVHPYVGLGRRLAQRGHRVTVAANEHFRALIERSGLTFVELGTEAEFQEAIHDPRLWDARRAFEFIAEFAMLGSMRRMHALLEELVRGDSSQAVMIGPSMALGARLFQETHGAPMISLHLQPSVLWSEYDSPQLGPLLVGKGVPRWFKRWQIRFVEWAMTDRVLCPRLNEYRRELGLSPVKNVFTRWWHSPEMVLGLFPAWFADVQPDWPPHTVLTGFPLWDESELNELSSELADYLAAGEPPIVFTAGSAMKQGDNFFAAAVEAAALLRRRALLVTRFADQLPRPLPPHAHHAAYVPFSQIFPRAAAVVHHGGIGTTAQCLAAGAPQLIMPMAHDQPDNAARLKRLGVADWLSPRAFTPRAVAARLGRLLDNARVASNCREYAGRLAEQNALSESCEVIERFMETKELAATR